MAARMSHLKIERKITNAFIRQAKRMFHEDHPPRYAVPAKKPKHKIGVQRKSKKNVEPPSTAQTATPSAAAPIANSATYDVTIGLAINIAADHKVERAEILAMAEQALEAARVLFNADKRISNIASTTSVR